MSIKKIMSVAVLTAGTMAFADTTLRLDLAPVGEIDPAKSKDYADSVAVNNVYDTLIADQPGGGMGPHLATSWSIDGNTYTFTLRNDVKFASGNTMSADDVVFSVNRFLKLADGYSYLISKVKKVEALDAKTVRFTLSEPYAPFVSALKKVWIVDSKTVQAKQDGWLSKNSAGSGAYMVTSHNPQNLTVFKKRHSYWAKSNPDAPDIVRMSYGMEAATVRASIEKGSHDLSSQWLPPEVLKALNNSGKAKIVSESGGGQLYVKMNTQIAPFDDINCRKGFVQAFNYDTVIKMIQITPEKSAGSVTNGTIPKGMMGYDANMPAFKQDLNKAKSYFAKCKYDANSLDIELAWMAEVPLEERFALMMQSDLKKIGIKSHVKKVPWVLFQDLSTKPETTPQVTQIFVVSNTSDPDALLFQQFHSSSKGLWSSTSWLNNAEVDRLLEQARAEGDIVKRTELYKQANRKIVALAPGVFGYDMVGLMALSNRVAWPPLEDASKAYTTSTYNIRFIDAKMQ